MNKLKFINGLIPMADDFNNIQENAENGIHSIRTEIAGAGILSGLTINTENNTATITPGVCYDNDGNRVEIKAPLSIDFSSLNLSSGAHWITVSIQYIRSEHGEVFDDLNQAHTFYHDDSYRVNLNVGVVDVPGALIIGDIQYNFDTSKIDTVNENRRKYTLQPKRILKRNESVSDFTLSEDDSNLYIVVKYPITFYLSCYLSIYTNNSIEIQFRQQINEGTYDLMYKYTYSDGSDNKCYQLNPGYYRIRTTHPGHLSRVNLRVNTVFGTDIIEDAVKVQ